MYLRPPIRLRQLSPSRRTQTASGSLLFGRIRVRLTLWYCLVLAGALLLFGAILYLGVQRMLFGPVQSDLARRAHRWSVEWQGAPQFSCKQPGIPLRLPPRPRPHPLPVAPSLAAGLRTRLYAACFNAAGVELLPHRRWSLPSPFIANNLALSAIRNGSAADSIDAGPGVGEIRRFALAVPGPNGTLLGVVQVGESIEGQRVALYALLKLLLILGGAAIVVAALSGLLLSSRTLAPARQAFRQQQSFLAAAAHELRTPLTLLRADAEVLLRGHSTLAPEDQVLLHDIVAESAHMAALAGTMLNLARLDMGHQHLEQEVVDLADLARDLAHRTLALAGQRQIAIQVEAETPTLVLGDRLLLDQAVLVLLDNALKYNRPGGGVTLRSRVEGKEALLAVHDTGIGIAPEHLPHLGERFYRVDAARSREDGGAGLGLSIARGIIAIHGGTLTVSSTPGAGTTATIRLPAMRTGPSAVS